VLPLKYEVIEPLAFMEAGQPDRLGKGVAKGPAHYMLLPHQLPHLSKNGLVDLLVILLQQLYGKDLVFVNIRF
jgi:hypothetical protein